MGAERRTRWCCLLAAIVTVAAGAADLHAKECGDDVAGQRVPCACGDTVVSDTSLHTGDPIVSGRCPGDGLLVRAPALAETITLDLAGLSLVGSGVGAGIEVADGGTDGAVILGGSRDRRGQVVGFRTGIDVRSRRAVRRIESFELLGQRSDGLNLHSVGALVIDVRAERNGGDGIHLVAQGGRLVNIEVFENAGAGIRTFASNLIVQARAERNADHGIVVSGTRNDLRGCSANGNSGHGVLLSGQLHLTDGVTTSGNRLSGIAYRGERRQ